MESRIPRPSPFEPKAPHEPPLDQGTKLATAPATRVSSPTSENMEHFVNVTKSSGKRETENRFRRLADST